MVLRSLNNNAKDLLCAAVLFQLQIDARGKLPAFLKSTTERKHCIDSVIATVFVSAYILSVLANISQSVEQKRKGKQCEKCGYETYCVLQEKCDNHVVSLANVSQDTP